VALQAEYLVDRRRLKRRLMFWRFVAVIAALAAIAVLVAQSEALSTSFGLKPQIARVSISGLIQDDRKQQELMARIAKAKQVKALVLRVNSPGGTATGGESLFDAIREVADEKPVVAVFGTIATSSAYMVGLASDHIVARGNSITGSVGVILQWAEVTELMKNIGIKMEEVKSGPLKASPSPFRPLDDAGRALTEEMVADAQKWFVELVAKRRSINPENIPGLTDGRIYSGRQALKLKLVDAIGGEKQALAWLQEKHKIPAGMTVIDWKDPKDDGLGWLFSSARAFIGLLFSSAGGLENLLGQINVLEGARLDGLVSVWHPSGNQ
jgi:protease-4